MYEPPAEEQYPYEVLDRFRLFFLFPRKGETKRLFKFGYGRKLVVTTSLSATTYLLEQHITDDYDSIRLTPFEARALKQVFEGGSQIRLHTVVLEPKEMDRRFFGAGPQTKVVVSDDILVFKCDEDSTFVVRGPPRIRAPWSHPSDIRLDQTEAKNLITVLSQVTEPQANR